MLPSLQLPATHNGVPSAPPPGMNPDPRGVPLEPRLGPVAARHATIHCAESARDRRGDIGAVRAAPL